MGFCIVRRAEQHTPRQPLHEIPLRQQNPPINRCQKSKLHSLSSYRLPVPLHGEVSLTDEPVYRLSVFPIPL